MAEFQEAGAAFADEVFAGAFGAVASMDFTDGARMTFASGDVVHIRPSGNAPEFRVYTESSTADEAVRNNDPTLGIVETLQGRAG